MAEEKGKTDVAQEHQLHYRDKMAKYYRVVKLVLDKVADKRKGEGFSKLKIRENG